MLEPKHHKIALAGILSIALLLSGCTSYQNRERAKAKYKASTDTLEGLQALGRSRTLNDISQETKSNIRVMAIKDVALSTGAQSGLASRAKYINRYLLRHSRRLDKIYDFSALMLNHNVLPPVLSQGQNALNLTNQMTIRIADRSYKIEKQAHFVTTPPNWRQYIWMDYNRPEPPHSSVLPKDRVERDAWDKYTWQGWQKGIEQADNIFSDNLARLKGDFLGMLLYRKLLAMNMVSPPYVAHTDLGITGDANKINIDDKIMRIVALPQLNVNSREWRASVSKLEGRLSKFRQIEKLAKNTKIEISDEAWQPVIPPLE